MVPLVASDILKMRAKAPGAPLTSSAEQSVMINSVDSYHIRLAVSGSSCDKYPGESPLSLNQGEAPQGRNAFDYSLCPLAELPSVC